jgi:hypothetical protein
VCGGADTGGSEVGGAAAGGQELAVGQQGDRVAVACGVAIGLLVVQAAARAWSRDNSSPSATSAPASWPRERLLSFITLVVAKFCYGGHYTNASVASSRTLLGAWRPPPHSLHLLACAGQVSQLADQSKAPWLCRRRGALPVARVVL